MTTNILRALPPYLTLFGLAMLQPIQQQTPETGIPHPDFIVPILWAMVGGLAVLIAIMLRLWYRDFLEWKQSISGALNALQQGQSAMRTELAGEMGELRQAKEEHERRLNKLEDQKP